MERVSCAARRGAGPADGKRDAIDPERAARLKPVADGLAGIGTERRAELQGGDVGSDADIAQAVAIGELRLDAADVKQKAVVTATRRGPRQAGVPDGQTGDREQLTGLRLDIQRLEGGREG